MQAGSRWFDVILCFWPLLAALTVVGFWRGILHFRAVVGDPGGEGAPLALVRGIRGAVVALMSCTTYVGVTLGAAVMGPVFAGPGYAAIGAVCAVIAVAAAALSLRLGADDRPAVGDRAGGGAGIAEEGLEPPARGS